MLHIDAVRKVTVELAAVVDLDAGCTANPCCGLTTNTNTACAQLLGRCIQNLPREDLFICTKVGDFCTLLPPQTWQMCGLLINMQLRCTLQDLPGCTGRETLRPDWHVRAQVGKYKAGESEDFSAERVTRSVHESLERLGLKYIDLIICHDIESAVDMKQARTLAVCYFLSPPAACCGWQCHGLRLTSPPDAQIVTDTLPALQKLKEQGLIRAIGISGLPLDIFSYVLDRCRRACAVGVRKRPDCSLCV